MTRVAVGSQSTAAAATALTTSSPTASTGNLLVLEISWLTSTASGGAGLTPSAPAGWSTALALLSSVSGTTGRAGYSVFYKTAAGGVESPVFDNPDSPNANLYAHGIISELPSGSTFDSTASAGANTTNNSAASTTGVTVPSTGTLAFGNSEIFTGAAIMAGTGLANAGIAFSGGSWTTDMSDQDTTASVGALQGYKAVAVTTPLNAVYTWTSDSTTLCYQAGIVVFSTSAGGAPTGPTITQQPTNQSAASGTTAGFSVTAQSSGGALSYQWQDNRTGAFSNVSGGSGATTASYTTPTLTQVHQGRLYRVQITDSNGVATSTAASVGVAGFALYLWDTTIPVGDDIYLRDPTQSGSVFDFSVLQAMTWPWPVITFSKPQVVAAGMTPPDNLPL